MLQYIRHCFSLSLSLYIYIYTHTHTNIYTCIILSIYIKCSQYVSCIVVDRMKAMRLNNLSNGKQQSFYLHTDLLTFAQSVRNESKVESKKGRELWNQKIKRKDGYKTLKNQNKIVASVHSNSVLVLSTAKVWCWGNRSIWNK